MATQDGHTEIVRLLLQEGADKDKANSNGATALLIASYKGHLDIVRFLLQEGADKDKEENNGTTALFVACCEGHLDVVRLLLHEGADKDKAEYSNGSTPLHQACLYGHTALAELLLLAGADTEKKDKFGRKALDLCPTEEMRAELEESSGCPVRRRRGRSCACCEVQEADGVGAVGGPPKFQLCSACKGVAYCSKTCQSLDWKARHKQECKVMQGLK